MSANAIITFCVPPYMYTCTCTATVNNTTGAGRQITFVNTGLTIIAAILGGVVFAISGVTCCCLCTKGEYTTQ